MTDPSAFDSDAAHTFIREHARPVEKAVHAVLFANGDPAAVVESLVPYRNDDGGFGHGLEPDRLVPDSQALHVEIAANMWLQLRAMIRCYLNVCKLGLPAADDYLERAYQLAIVEQVQA